MTIELHHLRFTRQNRSIFSDFSVTIKESQFIALLGPNGTGKSTLLKLMSGIIKPDAGEVVLHGKKLHTLTSLERARLISYMPQFSALQTDFTVEQVVSMGRYPHKSRFASWHSEDERKVHDAISLAQITHLKDRFLPSLSGGERQLVYLAKTIAQDTPILLLDEPTSDLDVYHQIIVIDIIKKLIAEGKTVIAAIHDINLAARVCDECLLIKHGEIVRFGKSDVVMEEETMKKGFHVHSHIYREPTLQSKQMIPYDVLKEVK